MHGDTNSSTDIQEEDGEIQEIGPPPGVMCDFGYMVRNGN